MSKYIDKNKLKGWAFSISDGGGNIDLDDLLTAIESQELNVDNENSVQSVCKERVMSRNRMTLVIEYDDHESKVGDFIERAMFDGSYKFHAAAESLEDCILVYVANGDKIKAQ